MPSILAETFADDVDWHAVGADRVRVSAGARPGDRSLSARAVRVARGRGLRRSASVQSLGRHRVLPVRAAARDRLGAAVANGAAEPWELAVVRLDISDHVFGVEPLRPRCTRRQMEQTMRAIIWPSALLSCRPLVAGQAGADTFAVPTGRSIEASALQSLLFPAVVVLWIAARAVGRCPRRRAAPCARRCADAARAPRRVATHRRRRRVPSSRAFRRPPVFRGGAGAVRRPAARDRRAVSACEPCARGLLLEKNAAPESRGLTKGRI